MPTQVRLIRLPEVARLTGYKRSSIYANAANGSFPAPVKLGTRASAWVESEILEWIKTRLAERDGSCGGGHSNGPA
jgi:prophage regulatory protein